jgi:hypothetical protein
MTLQHPYESNFDDFGLFAESKKDNHKGLILIAGTRSIDPNYCIPEHLPLILRCLEELVIPVSSRLTLEPHLVVQRLEVAMHGVLGRCIDALQRAWHSTGRTAQLQQTRFVFSEMIQVPCLS